MPSANVRLGLPKPPPHAIVVRRNTTRRHPLLKKLHRQQLSLPELRDRLEQLTLAVAKLPLYHKFLQEIKLHQDQHDALLVQRSQCAQKLLQLKQAVAAAERTLSDTEADLALIGFDEERHRRLETVREDAFRLRSERDRLISALRQAEQDEARVEHAQNLANQIAKEEAGRQESQATGPAEVRRR